MGLKEKALAGEKLEDVLIIDADAHYMVEYLPDFDGYIQRMDRVGIDKLFCSTMGNLDFQKSYPDRILSMYRYRDLSPDHELQKKYLMKWLDNPGTIGFGEVWPNGAGYPCNGDWYQTMWEVADSCKTVVMNHTWYPNQYCDPAMYAEIAEQYTNAQIVLVHSGGSVEGMLRAVKLVNKYDNVYMELNTTSHHYKEIEYLAKHANNDKVLYGSDFASEDFASQLGPIVFAQISEEIKAKFLGLNAKALLEKIGRYR